MFEYAARVVSVADGDTATFTADLGFHVALSKLTVRLAGINAPELVKGQPAGIAARDFLRNLLPAGTAVTLRTVRDRTEKYGRWLGYITTVDGTNVNDLMVSSGHAVVYLPEKLGPAAARTAAGQDHPSTPDW